MKEAKPTPTHKVSFYGIHCYFDCHTNTMWGVNWLCDQLIVPVSALHNLVSWTLGGGHPFSVKILEEL